MRFKDHFSTVSRDYASFRPSYPPALFKWLGAIPGRQELAWDCACGSGQGTLELSRHFKQVIGTDASETQIKAAPRDEATIQWRVAPAEASGLTAESVDLITVAQALHWFDLPKFYAEANRVLRPEGVLAVWCYGINEVEDRAINECILDFYSNVVGPFWPPERQIVETGYRTLDFPFAELEVPPFRMETSWSLPQLLGYFRTWSATTRYIAAHGHDPVVELEIELARLWGSPKEERIVRWPLSIRAGRRR
jgi:SAM-dependent methyltransferase